MNETESKGQAEQALLRTSITMLILMSCISLTFGVLTGSFAILFDGFYALIDASMGGLALLVSRLIMTDALRRDEDQPGQVRYQFGFWHLEPMVLALNAVMLTLAVLYAMGSALILIFDGGTDPDFGLAVVYAATVSLLCVVMAARQKRRNRLLRSGFIALDVKSWMMSGAISFALLVAFGVGWFLTGTRYEHLQPFVDPVILVLVCIAVLPMPFSDLRRAVSDMFLLAPEDLDAHVRRVAGEAVAHHGFADAYTYVARVGRSVLIEIHFLVPPDWSISSVARLDAIRDEVGRALGGEGPSRWLTICFTEDADWAF